MTKIFRKTRQKLLTENKFSKYLIYGIGEIILVVIGILIALQINTWNRKRIALYNSHSNLLAIIKDLEVDTLMFGKAIKSYKNIILNKEIEFSKGDFSEIQFKKLENLIEHTHAVKRINSNSFDKINKYNSIDIIESEYLINKMNRYYGHDKINHNIMMDWEIEYTNKEADYWDYEQEIFETSNSSFPKFSTFQNKEENRIQLIKLLESPKVRNLLKAEHYRKTRILGHFEQMHNIASKLIDDIRVELRKNK